MRKDKKGFTLIELIIVIAILAILTALITPKIQSYVEAANNQTDVANAQTMAREITYYYTLHPEELKYLQAFQNDSPGVVEVLVLPDGVRFTTYRNTNSDNQKRAMCDVESIFDPTVKSCIHLMADTSIQQNRKHMMQILQSNVLLSRHGSSMRWR
jgi:prepilin-type N-terminal cleavage/methylation domain-containing protein